MNFKDTFDQGHGLSKVLALSRSIQITVNGQNCFFQTSEVVEKVGLFRTQHENVYLRQNISSAFPAARMDGPFHMYEKVKFFKTMPELCFFVFL